MLAKLISVKLFAQQHYRWLALALGLIAGISTYGKFTELNSPDFRVFYVAAEHALSSPEKIYADSPDRFLYPPPAALIFTPFHLFPSWDWSKHAWYILSLLIIVLMARIHLAALVSTLILFRYFVINLRYGQINILLLAMMIFCAVLFLRRDLRSQLVAGFFLAAGGMIKLFPFVQSLDPLLRRRWISFLSMGVSILLISSVPILFWGWETTKELYLSYPQQLQNKGIPSYTHNQSFTAILFRFFSGEPFRSFSVGMVDWTVMTIPKSTLQSLGSAFGILMTAIAWFRAYQRRLDFDYMSAASFSILFLSHIVWKPYFIFLFIPLLQFLVSLRGRIAAIGLAGFIALGPLSSPDIWGVQLARTFDALSIHLIAALVLFVLWYIYPNKSILHKDV